MKVLLLFLNLLFAVGCLSQTPSSIDSVTNVICNKINQSTSLPDSTRIQNAFVEHLAPFVKNLSDSASEEIFKAVYFRLQKTAWDLALY